MQPGMKTVRRAWCRNQSLRFAFEQYESAVKDVY